MKRLIIADESVDFAIIRALRKAGFEVLAIATEHGGWLDVEVLAFAFRLNAFLITEDKDFGELTFRLKKPSHGILLIRLPDDLSETKAAQVLELFTDDFDRFWQRFSVLEPHKLRVKPLQF